MKTKTVCGFKTIEKDLVKEFLDSRRFSPDLRKEGNGIGEAYMYNKHPVEGYVYLEGYYLEKRGEEFATVLCTREVEGSLSEVENALLEYFLECEGYHYGTILKAPKHSELVAMLDLDAHQERVSFYRALLVLESNIFEAFAPTTEEARSFLIKGLVKHGIEEGLGNEWFKPYEAYIKVSWVAFGDCLRTENV